MSDLLAPVDVLLGGGRMLPTEWIEALEAVGDAAREAEVGHAIVGSLGIAISGGRAFHPTQWSDFEGGETARDLDVFLLGDEPARTRFRRIWPQVRRPGFPRVDLVPIFHDQIHFVQGRALLRLGRVAVPVDPDVFRPFEVKIGSVAVPILHPITHIHMMGHGILLPGKIRRNIRCLSRARRGPISFPRWPERTFRAFHEFKRDKFRRRPVHYRVLLLRLVLYHWETERRHPWLIRAKRYVRQRHPAMAACWRRLC